MSHTKWCLFALLLLAALPEIGAPCAGMPGLAAYMGRDLGGLSNNQRSTLLSRVAQLTGDGQVRELSQDVLPYWVAPFHGDHTHRMLFLANPNWDIPGRPIAWVYLFTRDWKPVASQTFPLGEREFLIDARVSSGNPLHRDLLMVRVSSAALLHTFRPDDERLCVQYYAYLHGRMALVREEDLRGAPIREIYDASGPDAGPTPPVFEVGSSIRRLAAADPAEQAASLVWLTGSHSADGFESWRTNPDVQRALAFLRRSSNPWIRDYAALGVASTGR